MPTLITRQGARLISDYYGQVVEDEDYTMPNDTTYRHISHLLDSSFERTYEKVTNFMLDADEIKEGIQTLKDNRLAGGFKPENCILDELTSFEQTYCLSRFLDLNPGLRKQTRTYAFHYSDDEVIPVWVKKPRRGQASIWTVMFGNTRGELKAPTYEEMAENGLQVHQQIFNNPLNCLEIHRNPTHCAALAMKSEARDNDFIDDQYRYQNYKSDGEAYCSASAELKNQKCKFTKNMVAESAGFNLTCFMEDYDPDENLLCEYDYENFFEEGYDDDAHPFVSAKDIVKTFPEAVKGNTDSLDALTERIFATRLDQSNIPEVQEFIQNSLFSEDE